MGLAGLGFVVWRFYCLRSGRGVAVKGIQARVALTREEQKIVRHRAVDKGVPVSVWLAEAAREKMAREENHVR